MKPAWLVIGATSVIAEAFAHQIARAGHPVILAGRDAQQLEIIAADLRLRYRVTCDVLCFDFTDDISLLITLIKKSGDLGLFIASSLIIENSELHPASMERMIKINISGTAQLVQTYLEKKQSAHRMVFLSSVAACKGRAKNSLYGGSKAAIEVYLQGLQQMAPPTQHITIARLGFIDTVQTFGKPGIFYASSPQACAKACWKAVNAGKRQIYHPFFWRYIMAVLSHLPFFLYRRLGKL